MANYTQIDSVINELLSDFSDRHQKILVERFGLNGERKTLQAIGDELGITRERVRQIESQSIKKIRPVVQEVFESLFNDTHEFLRPLGGIRHDDFFVRDVRHIGKIESSDNVDEKIRFVFLIGDSLNFHKEDDHLESFWFIENDHRKELKNFIKKAIKYFKKIEKQLILEEKAHLDEFNDAIHSNYLLVSKHFTTNPFGDFGPRHWPEINPKVIRDKAYLVLKKKEAPLHFRDIAKLIHELGIDDDKAHTQTVHNELIKSDQFALVGRGIYGLKDHGYEDGTVKEVIENILKENGPMAADDVLEIVKKKKILKDNTILLNLQNRNNFQRLEDGRYHLK